MPRPQRKTVAIAFGEGRSTRALTRAILAVSLSIVGVAAVVAATAGGAPSTPPATIAAGKPKPFLLECPETSNEVASSGTASATAKETSGDPRARQAAQRGLDFLAKEAVAWQERNNCYGCHVQAVTIEAFSVGRHHQYEIKDVSLRTVLDGMLTVQGGARHPGGLSHGSPTIGETGKILGAAAFARYDQWVDDDVRDVLLDEATRILEKQQTDGSVQLPWSSAPVATDQVQGTALAIVTWRQAYERSADDRWLTAIQRAEDRLRAIAAGWTGFPDSIQQLDYAIIGLLAAGVGTREDVVADLGTKLREAQNSDGGWGLTKGAPSEALATGQALYTLRLLGMTDRDDAIARGTSWLIERQASDGGWSHAGFGKAEAMWAVLGLVSIDVMTIDVAGLRDGHRIEGETLIEVSARDNKGGRVRRVDIAVDDVPVHGACADGMTWSWDARALSDGKHIVDVRATNARGEVSRRRFEVYAGNAYLTQVGTAWAGGRTQVSLRNLAEHPGGSVKIEVLRDGKMVHTEEQKGAPGPMSFGFEGDRGRYTARLTYRREDGMSQVVETPFVHDTLEAQNESFAQLEGRLALPDDMDAANTMVELLDDDGNVVARTSSTRNGQYRFKNIDGEKQYRVRVSKQGYKAAVSAPISTTKAKESKWDAKLVAE
jgi:squalene-hopene/tetraprenyl-beta-curcumene cyclase